MVRVGLLIVLVGLIILTSCSFHPDVSVKVDASPESVKIEETVRINITIEPSDVDSCVVEIYNMSGEYPSQNFKCRPVIEYMPKWRGSYGARISLVYDGYPMEFHFVRLFTAK